jgi:preprotein translocase subunit SecE
VIDAMARVNPAQFVQQVRAETAKVVWPTRRETGVTTLMVFIMAVIAATFFFGVDQFLALGVEVILNIGG